MRLHRQLLVGLTLLASLATAFSPEVHSTSYEQPSAAIHYFDDAPVVLYLNSGNLLLSLDSGKSWEPALTGIDRVSIDPVKKTRAFAFTTGSLHYVSNDRGKSWESFEVPMNADMNYEVNVNYKNPDEILLAFIDCGGDSFSTCEQDVYYTTDGFKSKPKLMMESAAKCIFTKSNADFTEGDNSRIICLKVERDKYGYLKRSELLTSTDFFKTAPTIINDASDSLAGSYVYDVRVIKSFVVALVQTDRYDSKSSSVLLFVSKDGFNFRKAIMNEDLVVDGFEFLESTKHSLHISAWGYSQNLGLSNVLASDSDGIHFRALLEHVETNLFGFSELDKVETIEGVWIAGLFIGYNSASYTPLIRSKITFDDGRSWHYLRVDEDCPGDVSCSLNVLGIEGRRGDGQSTTGSTPGILMAVGNTGNSLEQDVNKMHSYISRDGGYTWKKTLDEPVIFAFGDLGNIIVAAPYSHDSNGKTIPTNKVYYSLNQGNSWSSIDLDQNILPFVLTTAIDGTTTNFLLAGLREGGVDNTAEVLYSLDFSKAFDRTCSDGDMEKWYGRSQGNNEGACVFGHKDIYNRRKADADCFINKPFVDLKMEEVPCECTEADYECAPIFVPNSKGECVPDFAMFERVCAEGAHELQWETKRKIPGNLCKGGNVMVESYHYDCSEKHQKTNSIKTAENSFSGAATRWVFMDQSQWHRNDETVLVQTSLNEVYVSHDGGMTFQLYNTEDEILYIYLNPYHKDDVYLITANNRIHFSIDRATSFMTVETPSELNVFGHALLTFSNTTQGEFIFYGDEGCENSFADSCVPVTYHTKDYGQHWNVLKKNAIKCDFVGTKYIDTDADPNTIFCQVRDGDNFKLISSTDLFSTEKEEFKAIVGFASTTHYTVVAAAEGDTLKAYVTVDGKTFAPAHFPKNFVVSKQQAYTVLGSESGAIFFHVTTNGRAGSEFGAILKSNSNGTSFVVSDRYVNRNEFGYVDYERIEGLEGIAIINTVRNQLEAKRGALKLLQSQITFNDGSDWDFIQPPHTDSEGKKYPCIGKSLKDCALHLHGYTERKDTRDTFSSGSATGLLLGVGNVGDKLGPLRDASTFLTTDGGSTWKEIKKGAYQWEFGDRGSVIALVRDEENTNVLLYSLDEGNTWSEYKFTDDPVRVLDIVTVPSDTSKRFLLVTRSDASKGDQSKLFTVDFEGVFTRQCVLDLEHPDKDDFEFWTPHHPFESSNCLFGHESKYLRKLRDRVDCFIGSAPLNEAFKIERHCLCTRRDYECDYNYIKDADGTCKLVPGLQPEDPMEICRTDQNIIEYFEPTGYRKIPMSTCVGGQEFDKWYPMPCPGKEEEFREKHGGKLAGFGLAMVIVVPILVFCGATWFVYDKGIRRNGGFARFGEIRLGEDNDLIENNATDKVVNSIVRGGITVVAAVIATYKVIKMMDNALINKVNSLFTRTSRYSTRGAGFQAVGEQDFRDEDDILDDVLGDDDYQIDDEAQFLPEEPDDRLDEHTDVEDEEDRL